MALRVARNKLRAAQRRLRRAAVALLFSYDNAALIGALRSLGVKAGDSVLLHSAFEAHHGYRGSAEALIDAFIDSVGADGNLLMVSLPYRSSSLEYLSEGKIFDVRRTPSAMGLVSEFFRRRPEVRRSLHPTHPMLAAGPKADWFVEGHERCLYPCGPATPFEKLLQTEGKVAFFNVSFAYFTFFHYLEHFVRDRLDFPLYHEPPFEVPVVAWSGERVMVRTHVFSREAIARRRFEVLENWLQAQGTIRRTKIGASELLLVELPQVLSAVEAMVRQGKLFHELIADRSMQ